MQEKPEIIGVPYGARLEQVVLHNGEVHVWMAIKCRPDKYEDWQGTFLRIETNGRVTRVTHDDAYDYDHEFLVKKEDEHEYNWKELRGGMSDGSNTDDG